MQTITAFFLTLVFILGFSLADAAPIVEETTVYLPGSVPLVMVKIPAGLFQMGAYPGERSQGFSGAEYPQHTVSINLDYYMAKYELTQQQWLAVMGSWPGTAPSSALGAGDNYPAYYISWDDCQNFIVALNNHISSTGQGWANFRLPNEAEWEYACRAGTQTRFFFGDSLTDASGSPIDDFDDDGPAGVLPGNRSDYMWYYYNYDAPTYGSKPVGTKLPNQFGLYDMSGNVLEWCQDYWHDDYHGAPTIGSPWLSPTSYYRVVRGGYWDWAAFDCRSAARGPIFPDHRYYACGLRLARTQTASADRRWKQYQ